MRKQQWEGLERCLSYILNHLLAPALLCAHDDPSMYEGRVCPERLLQRLPWRKTPGLVSSELTNLQEVEINQELGPNDKQGYLLPHSPGH